MPRKSVQPQCPFSSSGRKQLMRGVFHFSKRALHSIVDEGFDFGCRHNVVGNVGLGAHFAGFAHLTDFVYAFCSENGCGDIGSCVGKVSRPASYVTVDDFFFKGLFQVLPYVLCRVDRVKDRMNDAFEESDGIGEQGDERVGEIAENRRLQKGVLPDHKKLYKNAVSPPSY
ncbi:hypothetical protein [Rossellomorea vietnamensis]|uniref:hypothetical protein n=1 Tax=Rossellomorea vietnamensis TaxID=218284 RepID=UPI001E528D01|nr:hypothetical protein [Rossellomorea vietnamensis]MCC5803757.1 hypothetical protein [Rossellomorea vietnamensis]